MLYGCIAVLIVLLFVYLTAGLVIERVICRPRKRNYERVKTEEFECGNIVDATYYDKPLDRFTIINQRGKKLCAHFFRSKNAQGRYILFNHGYNYPHSSVIKYLPMLDRLGYNVLFPDHIGGGQSDEGPITFGFFECPDSLLWLAFLRELAAKDGCHDAQIGVMGESMGAAVSLMMASQDTGLAFCIADCSYSSWRDIIRYRLKAMKMPYLVLFLPAAYLVIRVKDGASVKAVDLVRSAGSIHIPTLLIHGGADRYTPCDMSRRIAQANAAFTLFIQPGAEHARSISKDYPAYLQAVTNFLVVNELISPQEEGV